MSVTQCRSCDAPIFWVKTERGKRMPLDAAPYEGNDPSGLFVLRDQTAIAVPPDAFPDEPHYVSHFATCPDADTWRHPTERSSTS
jgi:hypothetical protein